MSKLTTELAEKIKAGELTVRDGLLRLGVSESHATALVDALAKDKDKDKARKPAASLPEPTEELRKQLSVVESRERATYAQLQSLLALVEAMGRSLAELRTELGVKTTPLANGTPHTN